MPKKNINKDSWLTEESEVISKLEASYADNEISLSELEAGVEEELHHEDVAEERKIKRVLAADFTYK